MLWCLGDSSWWSRRKCDVHYIFRVASLDKKGKKGRRKEDRKWKIRFIILRQDKKTIKHIIPCVCVFGPCASHYMLTRAPQTREGLANSLRSTFFFLLTLAMKLHKSRVFFPALPRVSRLAVCSVSVYLDYGSLVNFMWSSSVLSWCTILVSNIHDCALVLRGASLSLYFLGYNPQFGSNKIPFFLLPNLMVNWIFISKKGKKEGWKKGKEGGREGWKGRGGDPFRVRSCEKLSRRKGDTCCQVTLLLNWSHLQGMGCLCYPGCQQARKGLPNEGPKELWSRAESTKQVPALSIVTALTWNV